MSTRRYSDMKAAEDAASSENLTATPGTKAVPHKKSRVSDSPRSSRTTTPRTPLGDVSNNLTNAFNDTLGGDPNASTGSSFLQSPSMAANAMNHSVKFEPLFSDMSALDDSSTERTQPGRSLFDEIKEENPESSMLGSATPLYDTLNFNDNTDDTLNYVQNDTLDFMGLGKTPEPGEPEDLDVTLEADEVQVEVNGQIVVAEMSMLKVADGSVEEVEVAAKIEVQQEAGDAGDVIDGEVKQEEGLEVAEEVVLDVKVEVSGNIEVAVETTETPIEASEVPVETSETVEASNNSEMTTDEPSEPTPTTTEVEEVPVSEAQTEATVTPDETTTSEAAKESETVEQVDVLPIETVPASESGAITASKEPETIESADEPESMDITTTKEAEPIDPAYLLPIVPVRPVENVKPEPESMDITATSLVFPSDDRPSTPTSDDFVTPKMSPVPPEATTTTNDAPQPRGLGVSAFSPDVSLSVSGLGFNMEASDHSFLTSHRPSSNNDNSTAQKILNFNNESESANSSMNQSSSQSPQINDSILSFLGHEIKAHANLDQSMAMRSVSELQQKSYGEVAKLRNSNDELQKQLMEHTEIEARLKIDLEHARKDSDDWKLLYEELAAKNAKQRHHMKPIQDEALAEQLEELTTKLASEAHVKDEYRKETMTLRNTVADLTAKLQNVEQNLCEAAELKALKEEFGEVKLRLTATLETNKELDEEIRKLHGNEVNQNALIEELRKNIESKQHIDEESKKLSAKLAELGIEDVSKVLAKLDVLSKELAEKNASIDEMYTEIHNLERAKQTTNDKLEAMKEELEQAKVAAASVQFVESTPIVDTAALEAALAETNALKAQLASAQEEIATITTSRDSVVAQIEAFKAQLDNITMNTQMEQFEDISSRLNLKLDQLTDQNKDHRSKIDALRAKFAEQNHEIANLRATVAHYESAFKEQEEEADAKQGEHMATITKLKVELGAATDSLNTLSAENSKLTSVIQEANTKMAALEEARQSSEAFLVEANALLAEKSEHQTAQKARLDELEAEIAAIRTDYQKELDGAQKKLADNLECYQMLNAQIAEKDASIAELQAELTKVSNDAEAENESNVNALNKMQMELMETKEKLDEARQIEVRLEELQVEVTQKNAELADIQRQMEEVQSASVAAQTRLTELDAEVELKTAKIEELQAELDAARTQVASDANQEQVDGLTAEVAQKEAQIAAITAELDEKKAQYVELEGKTEGLEASVKSLEESLEAARAQADAATTLAERVPELETKLAEANQQLEAASAENAALKASINSVETDLATAQADFSTLKERVNELESQLAETKSLESAATTLKDRVTELESQLVEAKALESTTSALKDRVAELESALAEAKSIESAATSLKNRISELESALSAAKALESTTSTLKDRISELESQLSEARSLESAAKTDLLEQKASLDGLKAVSADLRQRVETLTNQKTDLEVSRREALAQKTEAEQQLAQIRVDLEEQYQAKETELNNAATALKAELESKAARIADLQREVTELRDQVLELETRELEQTISIPPMAPIADKIREAVAAQFNPIREELQAKVDQLINEKAELSTKMEIMQAKYARGKVVYQQLREERNNLREKLQKQAALTEASTNTDEVTTSPSTPTAADPAEIERLQARITAYKEQIGKLNDELDSTDDKMEGLMQQIFQRTVQMNELKRRLGDTDIEPVTSMEGM
uniref:TACC_C domain-containing protein n=1 Tax=Panagrellus redivivus TaxID=6233 RepID=A0A7E4UP96_PANRE